MLIPILILSRLKGNMPSYIEQRARGQAIREVSNNFAGAEFPGLPKHLLNWCFRCGEGRFPQQL